MPSRSWLTEVVRSHSVLFVGLLLLSACAVGERPTLTDEAIDEGATAALDGGAVAAAAAPDSTVDAGDDGSGLPGPDALGDIPPALLTPSGVLVPVLGVSENGYMVQTPCGNESELRWGQPIRQTDVVLDPGHGGDEAGTLGPTGETEAELNLDVARRTAAILDSEGISVVLTRTSDYRMPIRVRAAIADQLGALVLVSIHHNAPTPTPGPTNGPGTEVFIQAGSDESRRLGGLLHEEIVSALSVFDADWASRSDAGVLTVVNESGEDAYGINRYPFTTSALAELAYLSNPTEALVLATDEYRQAAAFAVAGAIIQFLSSDDGGSGFVDEPRLFTPSGATGGADGCIDPTLE